MSVWFLTCRRSAISCLCCLQQLSVRRKSSWGKVREVQNAAKAMQSPSLIIWKGSFLIFAYSGIVDQIKLALPAGDGVWSRRYEEGASPLQHKIATSSPTFVLLVASFWLRTQIIEWLAISSGAFPLYKSHVSIPQTHLARASAFIWPTTCVS